MTVMLNGDARVSWGVVDAATSKEWRGGNGDGRDERPNNDCDKRGP